MIAILKGALRSTTTQPGRSAIHALPAMAPSKCISMTWHTSCLWLGRGQQRFASSVLQHNRQPLSPASFQSLMQERVEEGAKEAARRDRLHYLMKMVENAGTAATRPPNTFKQNTGPWDPEASQAKWPPSLPLGWTRRSAGPGRAS